ncbi:MAG: TlpA disulfide reductase family protein [Alphaproteobacteria bacterium]
MKTKLLAVLIAILIVIGGVFFNLMMTPGSVPQAMTIEKEIKKVPFPDIGFPTADGKTIFLKDLKEPTVLVHFWAAWCAPCHAEFPDLLKYVEQSNGKIALLAISVDYDYKKSQAFLDKLDTDAPHLYWAWDKSRSIAIRGFNTAKIPETIIVQKGLMTKKIIGPGPWKEALKD